MPQAPRSRRARLAALSGQLRADGLTWAQIAARIRQFEHVNSRVAMRLAHGLTQAQVARLWNERWPGDPGTPGLTDKAVSYWETWPESGHEPSLKTLKRLAQLYQCDVGDLIDDGSFSHLDEREQREPGRCEPGRTVITPVAITHASGQVSAAPSGELAPASAGDGLASLLPFLHELGALVDSSPGLAQDCDLAYNCLITSLSRWADTVKRRELLRLVGSAASTAAVAPMLPTLDPGEQQRVAGVLAAPSRVDATALEHIEAVLWHARRQDDVLGPQAALATVLSQRDVLGWLVNGCPAALRPRALALLGTASRLAGWLSFDLGDNRVAWSYYEHARGAAHEARDGALGAQVLCDMSKLATWQGTPRLGIDCAVAAQRWAARTDDLPLKAYAYQVAAVAYAADGQGHALSELEHAEGYLDDSGGGTSVVYFNDRAELALDRSRCCLRLGDSASAASAAQRGLALTNSPRRDYSFYSALATLQLGGARLGAGEVTEAARVFGDVVVLAACDRSPRFTDSLCQCVRELEPWRDVRAVRDLHAQCADAGIELPATR